MKLIAGLGNPGKKYENTRHNVGHWAIGDIRSSKSRAQNVRLHKTSAFVNESGKEIKELVNKYKLSPDELLVVHDDLDLEPGAWKLQLNRSAAGHKGVQSIIDELGTQEFWRLRIGVGRPDKEGDKYVLEEPSNEDRELVEKAIEVSAPPRSRMGTCFIELIALKNSPS